MIFIIIVIIVFLIDQFSKYIINKKIKEGENKELIEDKLYITNIKNPGAMMGFLKNNRLVLLLVSGISIIILIKVFFDILKESNSNILKLGISLALGGGLGNIYDRFVKKEVTDFIYIKYKKLPVFNIADLTIASGFILFIISYLKGDI